MTIALVHGVPETSAIWDLLADKLVALGHDEPLRLSPPGFGAPVPEDWAATVHDYRAWLIGELENIGHPVDLVGHDWGGGHVLNVAMTCSFSNPLSHRRFLTCDDANRLTRCHRALVSKA